MRAWSKRRVRYTVVISKNKRDRAVVINKREQEVIGYLTLTVPDISGRGRRYSVSPERT